MDKNIKKISVIGYCGSGKSTLAEHLGKKYGLDFLNLDKNHYLPGWDVRPLDEELSMLDEFLKSHEESGWVIDGNFPKVDFDRRMAEADLIVFMNFNRFDCLLRTYHRYENKFRKVRKETTPGTYEKYDKEYVNWILWNGRTKAAKERYANVMATYPEKSVCIKNQRELDAFKKEHGLDY
ncbi:MAG: DNA topology modulation protein FlaR [Lachnospiraceae bacterium]|nr:DNA topology modulation protein FlaR [Lachnospiraceae bacterium]